MKYRWLRWVFFLSVILKVQSLSFKKCFKMAYISSHARSHGPLTCL